MLNYPIQNIANIKNTIYLFNRQKDGALTIMQDNIFKPYFYEESKTGIYQTIDGKRVNKITCREPGEIKRRKTETSYEADVIYPKRYMIDKVSEILPSPTKYLFIDIEIQTKELPSYLNPDKTITSISIYNSLEKKIRNWFIQDCHAGTWTYRENELLKNVVHYIKDSQPDLLLGWNFVNFDYPYFAARIKRLWNLELAELISPISKMRYGRKEDEIPYPAGISILDYLDLFKKIYNREPSNALDDISQKYLGTIKNKKFDFNQISEEIKEKNIEDIKKMVMLEKKLQLIPYYDEIRRMSKAFWEDLTWHSKTLDVMLLTEAKLKGIVLPNKKYRNPDEIEEEPLEEKKEFEGAYRHATLGKFKELYKFDLSSAYPATIIYFCLDISNLTGNKNEQEIKITDRETHNYLYSIYMKQNSNALLPTLARKLVIKKEYIKKQLKSLDPESEEGKDLQIKYDAIKALVNSLFGICGLKIFRLYNPQIASAITSIVRDLLHYVEDKLKEQDIQVIYVDTDSIMCLAKENPKDLLNQLVQQWAKEKYNRNNIDIEFDYEGIFKNIFILALCHYVGDLETKKGLKREIKGVEMKRKDSSVFMREFQTELIEKILKDKSQEEIVNFINQAKEDIKAKSLLDIGFPCKLSDSSNSPPIFMRGLEYTKEISNFNPLTGNLFYWIYVPSMGKATRISYAKRMNKETGKKERMKSEKEVNKDVLCFDEENQNHIKEIDWVKMIKRTIIGKCENVFEALGWEISLIKEVKIKKTKHND
jgi:DNA polymerase elongation subunit (family B)